MTRKVAHLINGLTKAGAETMLYQVIKYRTDDAPNYIVISLGMSHYYEESIRKMGIEVIELNLRKHPIKSIRQFRQILLNVDTLCCWMYISNLFGYIFGRKNVKKLIWCIRHSDLSLKYNGIKTIIISRICARCSKKVDVIAYNGHRASAEHRKRGYNPIRDCILENGLDLTEYYNDVNLRNSIRKKYGLSSDDIIILSVARNHPIKDIPTFIRMISTLRKTADMKAVLVGRGLSENNKEVTQMCHDNGLRIGQDIYLLEFCENINEIMNVADVYVLHSAGEAFPNTLIQAMACEIPVASTDVGDVNRIINDEKCIAQVGDFEKLADIVKSLLEMNEEERKALVKKNREIVIQKYDISNVVIQYEKLY